MSPLMSSRRVSVTSWAWAEVVEATSGDDWFAVAWGMDVRCKR